MGDSADRVRAAATGPAALKVAAAAEGAEIEVPTLDGTQTLKIPERMQTGARFKLRGEAVPDVNGRGDLRVHVEVRVPAKLTREQRRLFDPSHPSFARFACLPAADHGTPAAPRSGTPGLRTAAAPGGTPAGS